MYSTSKIILNGGVSSSGIVGFPRKDPLLVFFSSNKSGVRASVSGIHVALNVLLLVVVNSFVRMKRIAPICHIVDMCQ